MKKMLRFLIISLFVSSCFQFVNAETIGLFYNSNVPQIDFAAKDIINSLQSKGFTVEVLPLKSLSNSYSNKKVIISLASDAAAIQVLTQQGGTALPALTEQSYALRTSTKPQSAYWTLGVM